MCFNGFIVHFVELLVFHRKNAINIHSQRW